MLPLMSFSRGSGLTVCEERIKALGIRMAVKHCLFSDVFFFNSTVRFTWELAIGGHCRRFLGAENCGLTLVPPLSSILHVKSVCVLYSICLCMQTLYIAFINCESLLTNL